MSSVQAVIAALNQQSNTNDTRLPSHRQSKTDINSLRNRFGSVPTTDKPLQRSSHIETRTSTYNNDNINNNTNRPSSSIASYKKTTPSPSSSSSSTYARQDQPYRQSRLGASDGNTTNYNSQTKVSLIEQLEKVTIERDQLKRQLCEATHTPDTSSTNLYLNMEMPTLPPGSSCISSLLFEMNDCNEMDLSLQYEEYEDTITDYNRQTFIRQQQQHRINTLEQQLSACEFGTQWMVNKYLGDLEQERLYTRSLETIIESQDELINVMENIGQNNIPSTYEQQQTFLLHSQLELQRMELEDKQEILTLMVDERDILADKVKQLTHQLLHISTQPLSYHQTEKEGRQRNHPRTLSTSSTSSSSSYTTTTSILSLSCLDWVNINNIQQTNSPTSLIKPPLNRPYSPPQTPPPREKLPPLPMSGSASPTITPNISPRCTMNLSPSSPYTPGLPPIDCKGLQLAHQNSMPDIRSLHQQHRYRRHGSGDATMYSSFGGTEKGIVRQKSFWKGWRQRLSN